jgi:hypothetical protein
LITTLGVGRTMIGGRNRSEAAAGNPGGMRDHGGSAGWHRAGAAASAPATPFDEAGVRDHQPLETVSTNGANLTFESRLLRARTQMSNSQAPLES